MSKNRKNTLLCRLYKTCDCINTFLGPLPGPWMQLGQVRALECKLHCLHNESFLLWQRNTLARHLSLAEYTCSRTAVIMLALFGLVSSLYVHFSRWEQWVMWMGPAGVCFCLQDTCTCPAHSPWLTFPFLGLSSFPRACSANGSGPVSSFTEWTKLLLTILITWFNLGAKPFLYSLTSPFIFRNLYCLIILFSVVTTPFSSGSPFAALNNDFFFNFLILFIFGTLWKLCKHPSAFSTCSSVITPHWKHVLGACRVQSGQITRCQETRILILALLLSSSLTLYYMLTVSYSGNDRTML